jgi:hypothetical protein
LETYRDIYAKAMIEATGVDGKYTTKSALFGSPAGGSIRHFVRYLLKQVSGLHGIQEEEFLDWLGDNWNRAGEFVVGRLPGVVAPS